MLLTALLFLQNPQREVAIFLWEQIKLLILMYSKTHNILEKKMAAAKGHVLPHGSHHLLSYNCIKFYAVLLLVCSRIFTLFLVTFTFTRKTLTTSGTVRSWVILPYSGVFLNFLLCCCWLLINPLAPEFSFQF
jgi:hypothetical protein